MKPILSPLDETIIDLLKRVGALKAEYPPELLAARRAAFIAEIEQYEVLGGDQTILSDDQVFELLQGLKPLVAEYPSELLAARRAEFLAQIDAHNRVALPEQTTSQDPLMELLENLKPAATEYPAELLAARRASFIAQIDAHNRVAVPEEIPSGDPLMELLENLKPAATEYPSELLAARRASFIAQIHQQRVETQAEQVSSPNRKVLTLLERLKSIKVEYPFRLLSARRADFVTQIRESRTSVLDALRLAVKNLLSNPKKSPSAPLMRFRRASLVLAGMLVAVFAVSLLYENRQPLTSLIVPSFSEREVSHPSPVAAAPTTGETAKVICKTGYLPPLCLAKEFDKSRDLTFPGNGSARPAVAKDTIPGYSRIHQPAYVNDGLYGSGASWISNSPYSWIKIDLGEVRRINTITFGRDRLGNFNDGDPGQFIVAVAVLDDVYANGNSSNDSKEYTQVYNSEEMGFDGVVSGPETIQANFQPVEARYVKITFENSRTAVDEIEVFMLLPTELASHSTQRPRDTLMPPTFTPIPTNTLVPSRTPTLVPTNTFIPTSTATPRPTLTPRPTNTDVPTDTPEPPTNTPRPPTDTPEPPTDTREPPTDTPEPPPTDTPEPPPTNTSEPPTSEPSTATAVPELFITNTPEVLGP